MAKPKSITITPQSDADGICESQQPNSGGAQSLTINGALTSSGKAVLNHGHKILITSSANDSGNTFTITGKDSRKHGIEVTETISGPDSTTVESSTYFSEVTSIVISGNSTGNITVGTDGKCVSDPIMLDNMVLDFEVSFAAVLSSGAGLTYSVAHTLSNLAQNFSDQSVDNANWMLHDVVKNKTATEDGGYTEPIVGTRVQIESYSSGNLTFELVQQG